MATVLPNSRGLFQQNNAPWPTAKRFRKHFKDVWSDWDQRNLDWLRDSLSSSSNYSNSSDLNLIKYLWNRWRNFDSWKPHLWTYRISLTFSSVLLNSLVLVVWKQSHSTLFSKLHCGYRFPGVINVTLLLSNMMRWIPAILFSWALSKGLNRSASFLCWV